MVTISNVSILQSHHLISRVHFQNDILEKTMELEQLKVQLQYLQRIEANQQELIENFYENQ